MPAFKSVNPLWKFQDSSQKIQPTKESSKSKSVPCQEKLPQLYLFLVSETYDRKKHTEINFLNMSQISSYAGEHLFNKTWDQNC